MPRLDYGSGGGGGVRRPPLPDGEFQRQLWRECWRAVRPDPRCYRRSNRGVVSLEQQQQNYRELARAREDAERQAAALFEERLAARLGGA